MTVTFKERVIKLGLILAIFIPSWMQMVFEAPSMALGLLVASSFVILATFILVALKNNFVLPKSVLRLLVFLFAFISLHYIFSGIFVLNIQDTKRFIVGIAGFLFIIAGASIISLSFIELEERSIQNIIATIVILLIVNAFISITGIDFLGTSTHKPTFLFSEPSHLALIVAPFIILYMYKRLKGWLWFTLTFFIWAIVIQNLTMLLIISLALAVTYNFSRFILLIILIAVSLILFSDIGYFTNRLILTSDEANLSGLAFTQGWQNAYLSLFDTYGWGVGFQQFGIASSTGEITEKLNSLGMEGLNILDGGTTAAKLVGEFGLFGIGIVLMLVIRAAKAFADLKNKHCLPTLVIFARCTDISILFELFIRGVGYFSPSLFIYTVMFFVDYIYKKRRFQFSRVD